MSDAGAWLLVGAFYLLFFVLCVGGMIAVFGPPLGIVVGLIIFFGAKYSVEEL